MIIRVFLPSSFAFHHSCKPDGPTIDSFESTSTEQICKVERRARIEIFILFKK
jgi:hypothetical protein